MKHMVSKKISIIGGRSGSNESYQWRDNGARKKLYSGCKICGNSGNGEWPSLLLAAALEWRQPEDSDLFFNRNIWAISPAFSIKL